MGTFVAEAGTDVSVGGEKAKNGENNYSMEIKAGAESELGSKSPPMQAQLDGKSPNELTSLRGGEGQKVDENQDPLKDWGYTPGEPDYVHKCNGNPDSQIYENGDGDLPSFSIKRLRRLPLRVTSDQQPSTLASRDEPTGIAGDRNRPDDERGETLVADGNVVDGSLGDRSEAESGSAPLVQADEKVEQRQTLPGSSAVDAAHSSDDSVGLHQQEQGFSDLSRSKDDVVVPLDGPPNVLEEGTDPIVSPGVRNGEIGSREPELVNGKHAIEEAEFRNPGRGESGIADISPGPDLSFGRTVDDLPSETEKQTGSVSGHEISEENKDSVAAPEHALSSSNTLVGESENTSSQSHESHIPSPNPEVEHTTLEHTTQEHSALEHSSAIGLEADNQHRENASPGISDSPSLSAGLGSVSDKENIKVEPSALVAEDSKRDTLTEENGKAPEDIDLVVSTSPAEPAELPSPGIVHILPPVMGSRFESAGETTDEETDSPRSSEGFAYPDSDAMTLPYSGQIMYPARFSSAQTSNGPSLLQYSGSMSLRSDSSTTSNRSFAFPILAPPEWNSSPVRMAKAHPRRKNRFDGCCFFRLSRNKY
ncbi:hypothetical protein M758_4G175500 [Ceratodon purpureus]|nr:hypothetical protein M758_4G175500 [Ceratodon purpureus]